MFTFTRLSVVFKASNVTLSPTVNFVCVGDVILMLLLFIDKLLRLEIDSCLSVCVLVSILTI